MIVYFKINWFFNIIVKSPNTQSIEHMAWYACVYRWVGDSVLISLLANYLNDARISKRDTIRCNALTMQGQMIEINYLQNQHLANFERMKKKNLRKSNFYQSRSRDSPKTIFDWSDSFFCCWISYIHSFEFSVMLFLIVWLFRLFNLFWCYKIDFIDVNQYFESRTKLDFDHRIDRILFFFDLFHFRDFTFFVL